MDIYWFLVGIDDDHRSHLCLFFALSELCYEPEIQLKVGITTTFAVLREGGEKGGVDFLPSLLYDFSIFCCCEYGKRVKG